MGKYCCFLDPVKDYSEKSLNSLCPICNQPYGFPLKKCPPVIGGYKVVEPIDRGFYGATYLCEIGRLRRKVVLKVSSKAIYDFFNKNFEEECRIHEDVAKDTEHIVNIEDYFEETINFGSTPVFCHVAVLEYVEGITLDEYLIGDEISTRSLAQIAIDLFRIWQEFGYKHKFHNDFHGNNILIQHLREDAKRAEAIDDTIRAVAIDLGSVSDKSLSHSELMRLGDQHWLSKHLQNMMVYLQNKKGDIDRIDDLDNRIIEAFERIIYFLLPSATAGRVPTPEQLIRLVRDYYTRRDTPWKNPLQLMRFDDSYNAAALDPWYVPFLLVDPDGTWINRISSGGPLIVTGMRGCGKTMLLRSLEVHARAAIKPGENEAEALSRLKNDRYVGLFASCMSLLTSPGQSPEPTAAIERLFLTYCLQVVRAVRHIKELDRRMVTPMFYEYLAESIQINLDINMDFHSIKSDYDLESFIHRTKADLTTHSFVLKNSPAVVFNHLSDAIKKCSPLWSDSKVFFLLDDVSTRYLNTEMIEQLFSALFFQSPACAFKLTTEVQALEMVLRSPGGVELARIGRDYDVFDLGADVYKKTMNRQGARFVESILWRRATYHPGHPNKTPKEILGETSLEEIATNIASSTPNSRIRKSAYHGLQVLSAVCVGDIGDVISIYELILNKFDNHIPIPKMTQSQCYLDFCSRRLYDVNRRDSRLKDFAVTFAEASNELLVKSGGGDRLRQYLSIYVRITTGNTSWQFEEIRKLVDAGVFVLHGGTYRTKTKDSDPFKQFKLTYRKLFGLSSFIGLSERDRFELSGSTLEEWLKNPTNGKEILMRHLGRPRDSTEQEFEEDEVQIDESSIPKLSQIELFEAEPEIRAQTVIELPFEPPQPRLTVKSITNEEITHEPIELAILGLGFEERSLSSVERWLSLLSPKQAILIKYPEEGEAENIKKLIISKVPNVTIVEYQEVLKTGLEIPEVPTFIDVTGLAKPVIFWAIRDTLRKNGMVWFAHTRAETYYPLDSDLANILEAERKQDDNLLLEALASVLTGEKGPYSMAGLLGSNADESLRTVLCTFSSAKHERLLSLLDAREFDRVEIAIPPDSSARNKTARLAAEIVASNFKSTGMKELSSNDIAGVMEWLTQEYVTWYTDRGFNVELGLTGSKLQAVACAAISSECKIAQCWYIRPDQFEPKTFTKGTGVTSYYKISRNRYETV